MYFNMLFTANLINISPDTFNNINGIALFFMTLILLAFIALLAWKYLPVAHSGYKKRRMKKLKFEKEIWFDSKDSTLHKGQKSVEIPDATLEYYVCKLVLKSPTAWITDTEILSAAGEEDKSDRAVYFAVDRVNNKARKAFGLDQNLLKRRPKRESTRLNDNYF